uniref:Uncharacterized protein n=1 Tax=Echinococcus granulosus TaxID=6210 RepID=A0A068WT69_ECHGR|nr:hypothetical protein EgrG_002039300 [Echinococcus granulosus]
MEHRKVSTQPLDLPTHLLQQTPIPVGDGEGSAFYSPSPTPTLERGLLAHSFVRPTAERRAPIGSQADRASFATPTVCSIGSFAFAVLEVGFDEGCSRTL